VSTKSKVSISPLSVSGKFAREKASTPVFGIDRYVHIYIHIQTHVHMYTQGDLYET